MKDILAFELEKIAELLKADCEKFTLEKRNKDSNTVLSPFDRDDVQVKAWNPERIYTEIFCFDIPKAWLQAAYDKTVLHKEWEFKLIVADDELAHPFQPKSGASKK